MKKLLSLDLGKGGQHIVQVSLFPWLLQPIGIEPIHFVVLTIGALIILLAQVVIVFVLTGSGPLLIFGRVHIIALCIQALAGVSLHK
eukprot:2056167-Amphidinium_carterae.1